MYECREDKKKRIKLFDNNNFSVPASPRPSVICKFSNIFLVLRARARAFDSDSDSDIVVGAVVVVVVRRHTKPWSCLVSVINTLRTTSLFSSLRSAAAAAAAFLTRNKYPSVCVCILCQQLAVSTLPRNYTIVTLCMHNAPHRIAEQLAASRVDTYILWTVYDLCVHWMCIGESWMEHIFAWNLNYLGVSCM